MKACRVISGSYFCFCLSSAEKFPNRACEQQKQQHQLFMTECFHSFWVSSSRSSCRRKPTWFTFYFCNIWQVCVKFSGQFSRDSEVSWSWVSAATVQLSPQLSVLRLPAVWMNKTTTAGCIQTLQSKNSFCFLAIWRFFCLIFFKYSFIRRMGNTFSRDF